MTAEHIEHIGVMTNIRGEQMILVPPLPDILPAVTTPLALEKTDQAYALQIDGSPIALIDLIDEDIDLKAPKIHLSEILQGKIMRARTLTITQESGHDGDDNEH